MGRLVFVVDFLLVVGVVSAAVNRISLRRTHRSPLTGWDPDADRGSFKALGHRQRRTPEEPLHSERLTNFKNVNYQGVVLIGTPPQEFQVDFDTGSTDFWVFGPQVSRQGPHSVYRCLESATCEPDRPLATTHVTFIYGSGSVGGHLKTDNVSFAGLSVERQSFMEATDIAFNFEPGFDGLLGMAYPNISVTGRTPFFQNLLQANEIDHPVFAFYLNPNVSELVGGELSIGGADSKFFHEPITYAEVTKKGYWEFKIDSIQVNGTESTSFLLADAIADTGTTLIWGPLYAVMELNEMIGAIAYGISGVYKLDCNAGSRLPTVTFVINGTKFPLTGAQYVYKVPNSVLCLSAFVGRYSFNLWIIGDTFLSRYYTIFDFGQDRVGFARARTDFVNPTEAQSSIKDTIPPTLPTGSTAKAVAGAPSREISPVSLGSVPSTIHTVIIPQALATLSALLSLLQRHLRV